MKRSPLRPISARRLAELQRDGKRPGLARRTRLSPGTVRLARGSRIKLVNPKRKAARMERDYGGPKADWIRSLPCCVPACSTGLVIVAAHARSRGAGGHAESLVSMCAAHHLEQHDGIKTFEAKHGIDLLALAAGLEARWQTEGNGSE